MPRTLYYILLTASLYPITIEPLNREQKGNTMINIGLDEKGRQEVSQRLNTLLANEYVLYTKTLKYHWNVEGKLFGPLHSFFGDQYEALLKIIDGVAERIRSLGIRADGTLQEFMSKTSLKEDPGVSPDDMGMIKNLLDDHETIIRQLRDDIALTGKVNDMGTNNFLSDLIENHEKMAWMLRAHLK